jgi:hypothetical protein
MGNRLIWLSFVYVPTCIAFYVSEPIDMPHVVVTLFWLSMLLSGILYDKYSVLNESKWSVGHFWCHAAGLPLVIASFLGISLGHRGLIQVLLALGSYSICFFVIVLFIRVIINWKALRRLKR